MATGTADDPICIDSDSSDSLGAGSEVAEPGHEVSGPASATATYADLQEQSPANAQTLPGAPLASRPSPAAAAAAAAIARAAAAAAGIGSATQDTNITGQQQHSLPETAGLLPLNQAQASSAPHITASSSASLPAPSSPSSIGSMLAAGLDQHSGALSADQLATPEQRREPPLLGGLRHQPAERSHVQDTPLLQARLLQGSGGAQALQLLLSRQGRAAAAAAGMSAPPGAAPTVTVVKAESNVCGLQPAADVGSVTQDWFTSLQRAAHGPASAVYLRRAEVLSRKRNAAAAAAADVAGAAPWGHPASNSAAAAASQQGSEGPTFTKLRQLLKQDKSLGQDWHTRMLQPLRDLISLLGVNGDDMPVKDLLLHWEYLNQHLWERLAGVALGEGPILATTAAKAASTCIRLAMHPAVQPSFSPDELQELVGQMAADGEQFKTLCKIRTAEARKKVAAGHAAALAACVAPAPPAAAAAAGALAAAAAGAAAGGRVGKFSARSTSKPATGSMAGSQQQQGRLSSGGFSVLELQELLQQVSGTRTAKQLITPFWHLAARQCGSRGAFAEKRAQVPALLLLLQWKCRVSNARLAQTLADPVGLSAFAAAAAGVVGDEGLQRMAVVLGMPAVQHQLSGIEDAHQMSSLICAAAAAAATATSARQQTQQPAAAAGVAAGAPSYADTEALAENSTAPLAPSGMTVDGRLPAAASAAGMTGTGSATTGDASRTACSLLSRRLFKPAADIPRSLVAMWQCQQRQRLPQLQATQDAAGSASADAVAAAAADAPAAKRARRTLPAAAAAAAPAGNTVHAAAAAATPAGNTAAVGAASGCSFAGLEAAEVHLAQLCRCRSGLEVPTQQKRKLRSTLHLLHGLHAEDEGMARFWSCYIALVSSMQEARATAAQQAFMSLLECVEGA